MSALPITFLWPDALWGLILLPGLVFAYLWLSHRQRRRQHAYAGMSPRSAPQTGDRSQPTIAARALALAPAVTLLVATALLIVASARPVAVIQVPSSHQVVILTVDVSGSMRAGDIEPSRIEAAKLAAREFIESQPSRTRIGLVTFAGSASLVQAPTDDREALKAALDRIQLQRATALGSALIVSLAAIFPDGGIDLAQIEARAQGREPPSRPSGPSGLAGTMPYQEERARLGAQTPREAREPGTYPSAAIVLLSDGESSTGLAPLEAAKVIAQWGVRVYTVGVGSTQGALLRDDGWSVRVRLDEKIIKAIADTTRGEYFQASSAGELRQIYSSLGSRFALEPRRSEVSGLLAGLAALMILLGAGVSLWSHNRVIA